MTLTVECGFVNQSDTLVSNGPTIYIQVGIDYEFRFECGVPPQLPSRTYPALIDSGAVDSCIDSTLATDLALPVINTRRISGVHGVESLNVHVAQICIPALGIVNIGEFCGVHLLAGGQPHYALLGRTFLKHVTMLYQGETGSVVLSREVQR